MKQSFGMIEGLGEAHLWTLENEKTMVQVTDFGAALVSLKDKQTGLDVVQGFDNVQGYVDTRGTCFGASIGRTANRTAKGRFTLNGKEYHLFINNNGNSHHGGEFGFDRKLFEGKEEGNSVIFTRLSPDGEENYPGNLEVKITYTLLEDGVSIKAEGTSDADTLFSYTNHAYFNLDESDTILDHQVMIPSDEFAQSDETGMMKEFMEKVEGTPFDFREFHAIGERIDEDNEQLKLGAGYDHWYPIPHEGMRLNALMRGKQLELIVESDFPGVHIYTSNWFTGWKGKNNHYYTKRSSAALEASYLPNAINYETAIKPICKANKTLTHEIRFRLRNISGEAL
jgi:aldose 1-epimerase